MVMMKKMIALLVLAAIWSGCGAVRATKIIWKAEDMLEKARAENADQDDTSYFEKRSALFHYWEATHYLHKAKEEDGYADFEKAVVYGRKAYDHARMAYQAAGSEDGPESEEVRESDEVTGSFLGDDEDKEVEERPRGRQRQRRR